MKNTKYRITVQDFLKANRKASRDEEIAAHGKQITFRKTLQKSRKVYDRNPSGLPDTIEWTSKQSSAKLTPCAYAPRMKQKPAVWRKTSSPAAESVSRELRSVPSR